MNIDSKKILYYILVSHIILWTIVPTIFNINLPLDTIEGLAWGNELKLGYDKYPPIFPLFTELFFKIFGNNHKTLDGTPVRDFIHVDDLANIHFESLKYLIKNKKNQICNCGYGKGYSIEHVIKTLYKNKEMNLNYSFSQKRPGDISYMVADTKKLNRILNWKPKYSNLKKMIFSELRWRKKLTNN